MNYAGKSEEFARFENWLLFFTVNLFLLFGVFLTLQIRGCIEKVHEVDNQNPIVDAKE